MGVQPKKGWGHTPGSASGWQYIPAGGAIKYIKPLFFLIIPDISPDMLSASSESNDK